MPDSARRRGSAPTAAPVWADFSSGRMFRAVAGEAGEKQSHEGNKITVSTFTYSNFPAAVRLYASAIAHRHSYFRRTSQCDSANLTHFPPLSLRFNSNQAAATFRFRLNTYSESNLKCF